MNNYDIVIVGAGISGLYCALKLQNKYNILLIEKKCILGGRIFTDKIKSKSNDYSFEVGAGRVASSHLKVLNLIKELELDNNLIQIPTNKTFISTQNNNYNFNIDNLFEKAINLSSNYKKEFLINITFGEYLKLVLSLDEFNYIILAFGYKSEFWLFNAYDGIISFKQDFSNTNTFYAMKGGFNQIIDKMLLKLSKIEIRTGTEFKDFSYNSVQKKYSITCVNKFTQKINCSKIIFAIPYNSLIKINHTIFKTLPMQNLLHSVNTTPLCRIYAIYGKNKSGKIWFENIGKITTDNEIQYIIPIDVKKGIIMISYSDYVYADYWNQVNLSGLLHKILMYKLKEIFPDKDIPEPFIVNCYYWKIGTHYFKKGVDSSHIINTISKPYKSMELYICNESYSSNQAWMEGSIKSSENVIQKLI